MTRIRRGPRAPAADSSLDRNKMLTEMEARRACKLARQMAFSMAAHQTRRYSENC